MLIFNGELSEDVLVHRFNSRCFILQYIRRGSTGEPGSHTIKKKRHAALLDNCAQSKKLYKGALCLQPPYWAWRYHCRIPLPNVFFFWLCDQIHRVSSIICLSRLGIVRGKPWLQPSSLEICVRMRAPIATLRPSQCLSIVYNNPFSHFTICSPSSPRTQCITHRSTNSQLSLHLCI